MEKFKIKISNYRNIPDNNSIEFVIKEGCNFILGVNNIGKSNLLKVIFDFREIWKRLAIAGNAKENMSFSLSETFDHVKNQISNSNVITIEIEQKNILTTLSIRPTGAGSDMHTRNASCDFSSIFLRHDDNWDSRKNVGNILANSFYIGAYRTGIHNASGKNNDISVGGDFINSWRDWSVGPNITHNRKIQVLTSELKELFGYKKFEIRLNSSGNNLSIACDDGTFLLSELGDGIGHFIIVLANVLINQPSIVLIDEPEIGLHPRMQEIFMRALSSKTTFGILATSHSVGLARSTADNIYSYTKSSEGKLNLLEYGKHFKPTISQSISEMGYSQYAELGGNNILLVEGRTDIKAFREILRKFNIDQHYIVMSFGGSQFTVRDKTKIMDELQELKRFNTNVFVIFDSEKTKENDTLRQELKIFNETCTDLGFVTFATEGHSSDNYISQTAIDKVIGNNEKALTKFENPKRWESKKEKNWLMFREMDKDDFNETELKKFIEGVLIPSSKKTKDAVMAVA